MENNQPRNFDEDLKNSNKTELLLDYNDSYKIDNKYKWVNIGPHNVFVPPASGEKLDDRRSALNLYKFLRKWSIYQENENVKEAIYTSLSVNDLYID